MELILTLLTLWDLWDLDQQNPILIIDLPLKLKYLISLMDSQKMIKYTFLQGNITFSSLIWVLNNN